MMITKEHDELYRAKWNRVYRRVRKAICEAEEARASKCSDREQSNRPNRTNIVKIY